MVPQAAYLFSAIRWSCMHQRCGHLPPPILRHLYPRLGFLLCPWHIWNQWQIRAQYAVITRETDQSNLRFKMQLQNSIIGHVRLSVCLSSSESGLIQRGS